MVSLKQGDYLSNKHKRPIFMPSAIFTNGISKKKYDIIYFVDIENLSQYLRVLNA
jgi:hypothetical protein